MAVDAQKQQQSPEQTEFPRAGFRARRWSRFERDLYAWINRPEGQFECWLAQRAVNGERRKVGSA